MINFKLTRCEIYVSINIVFHLSSCGQCSVDKMNMTCHAQLHKNQKIRPTLLRKIFDPIPLQAITYMSLQ